MPTLSGSKKSFASISIVTVVRDSNETIGDSIRSTLNQDYDNIEYIIIDGGSRDGTVETIESYKDQISKTVSEADQGIYDAMNKGISLASGEYIVTLNSDDFYPNAHVIKKMMGKDISLTCLKVILVH